MYDILVKQYAARECATEQLKAKNQAEWIRRMNNIRASAEEIVISELIMS